MKSAMHSNLKPVRARHMRGVGAVARTAVAAFMHGNPVSLEKYLDHPCRRAGVDLGPDRLGLRQGEERLMPQPAQNIALGKADPGLNFGLILRPLGRAGRIPM